MRALVVIGSVLAAWLLAGSLVQSQSPPLAISLSGPDTCENDVATDYLPGAVRAPEVENRMERERRNPRPTR